MRPQNSWVTNGWEVTHGYMRRKLTDHAQIRPTQILITEILRANKEPEPYVTSSIKWDGIGPLYGS